MNHDGTDISVEFVGRVKSLYQQVAKSIAITINAEGAENAIISYKNATVTELASSGKCYYRFEDGNLTFNAYDSAAFVDNPIILTINEEQDGANQLNRTFQ